MGSPNNISKHCIIKKLTGMVVVTSLLIGLAGCKVNTNPRAGTLDPALPYTRIMINDDALAAALGFDEPIIIRDDDGFIRSIEVTVRAASIEPLTVDYRPRFKNASGATMQPEPSWRTKHLEKRVPEKIVMKPNGRNATDYEILFRWSR